MSAQIRAHLAKIEAEAAELGERLAPEARIMAKGATVVAKRVPDAIASELRAGLEDGSIVAVLRSELLAAGWSFDPEDAAGLAKLALVLGRLVTGHVVNRWGDLATHEIENLLTRATVAETRAITLREQATALRGMLPPEAPPPVVEVTEAPPGPAPAPGDDPPS